MLGDGDGAGEGEGEGEGDCDGLGDGDGDVKMDFKMFNFGMPGGMGDGAEMDIDMGDIGKMFGGKLQDVMKQALKKGAAGSTFTIDTDGMDVEIDDLLSGMGSSGSGGKRKKKSNSCVRVHCLLGGLWQK